MTTTTDALRYVAPFEALIIRSQFQSDPQDYKVIAEISMLKASRPTAYHAILFQQLVLPVRGDFGVHRGVQDIEEMVSSHKHRGAVINISNLCDRSTRLQTAAKRAEGNGTIVVPGAGNDREDVKGAEGAYKYDDSVICIGTIDKDYHLARWGTNGGTNFGKRVTLFAPGKDLIGFNKNGAEDTGLEGTSFAAPYVTGLLATFLGVDGPRTSLERVKDLLKNIAEQRILDGSSETVRTFSDSGFQSASGGLPDSGAPSPTQSATSTASPSSTPPPAPPPPPPPPQPMSADVCAHWYEGVTDRITYSGQERRGRQRRQGCQGRRVRSR